MAANLTERQASVALGDKIMKSARELDAIRVYGSNVDARNFEEALTRIKGIASRIQSGALSAKPR